MIHKPVRVLIVDDEPAIRKSLTAFLDDYDYDVSSAETAEEALNLLEKAPHDVAIVDIRLPGMNGDAMIIEARKNHPEMHFIVHTGSVHFSTSDEFPEINIPLEHVFLKPQHDMSLFSKAIKDLVYES